MSRIYTSMQRITSSPNRAAFCIAVLATLLVTTPLRAQQETGGVTGADFLDRAPAGRYTAMGNVLDGLGGYLEGVIYNPALLAVMTDMTVQVGITPLPNEVSQNYAAVSLPLFGGTLAAAAQYLDAGSFTFVNELGQQQGTVSIFDVAAIAAYGRPLVAGELATTPYRLAAGGALKGIYQGLGSYSAISGAADIGVTLWLETPHVGRPPRPPTDRQLQRQLESELQPIARERERRFKQITGPVGQLTEQRTSLEQRRAAVQARLDAAETPEAKAPLEQQLGELAEQLVTVEQELASAEAEARDALAALETWQQQETAAAQERHGVRLSTYAEVEAQRAELFEVINDPEQELEAELIDQNVDTTIAANQAALEERIASLNEVNLTFARQRRARITQNRDDIRAYQQQIAENFGQVEGPVQADIDRLTAEKQRLEAAEEPDQVRLTALNSELRVMQGRLDELLRDPWRRRLGQRVSSKEQEIEDIERAISAKQEDTQAAIENVRATAARVVARLEDTRETLQRELKKAKLRRELELLQARREPAQQRAQRRYRNTEVRLYERLLAVMYEHQERLFRARLEAVREAASARAFDFDAQQRAQTERIDDELAFQQRLLAARLRELRRQEPVAEDEVAAVEEELAAVEAQAQESRAALQQRHSEFQAAEKARIDGETAAIREQRRLTRLVFLQRDEPTYNTSINVAARNLGLPVTFTSADPSSPDGTPFNLPMALHASLGYGVLNTELHAVRLAVQANVPFFDQFTLGVGGEYVFADLISVRGGYTLFASDRSFAAGLGVRLPVGFIDVHADYAFQPLDDYGLLHSFGVSMAF